MSFLRSQWYTVNEFVHDWPRGNFEHLCGFLVPNQCFPNSCLLWSLRQNGAPPSTPRIYYESQREWISVSGIPRFSAIDASSLLSQQTAVTVKDSEFHFSTYVGARLNGRLISKSPCTCKVPRLPRMLFFVGSSTSDIASSIASGKILRELPYTYRLGTQTSFVATSWRRVR